MAATIEAVSGFAHLTDLPCLRLVYGQATAVISLYGAHVLSYQPDGNTEVLYLSPQARWKDNTPIRGGVPVCWPWFGPAAAEFQQPGITRPSHGLVRNQLWQLKGQLTDHSNTQVRLGIDLPAPAGFPSPLNAELELTLSADGLQIALFAPASLQQAALHSYFCVQQLEQVEVSPLAGVYRDKVKNENARQQQSSLTFTEEIDRVYVETAEQLSVSTGQHQLTITQQGHDASVLWNPWQDKAAKLTDLPDQGYLDFVCVETARLSLNNQNPLHLVQHIRYLGQLV
ncbi:MULTISPECIES: D-hexose-6-phosphate mutarotase [Rheinheimera]|uniref:Putative glucose-6-phosphate 1-epimerase n=1 Tax=Rheinheimera marina TaxID=1774958 RepID=A0ABV9JIW7_9GAMM